MKRVVLHVTRLMTDRDGDLVHYEVDLDGIEVIGDVRVAPADGYDVVVARVPDNVGATLVTPDARLALAIVE